MNLRAKLTAPRALTGVVLFTIPIVGACIPPAMVDLVVPRDNARIEQYLQAFGATAKLNAETAAAFYYLAISAAIFMLICLASIYIFLHLLAKMWRTLQPAEKFWVRVGGVTAFVLPLIILLSQSAASYGHSKVTHCKKLAIDDCVVVRMFEKTILALYNSNFAFKLDTNALAFAVFFTYLLATLTIVTSANMEHLPEAPSDRSRALTARTTTINLTLFLTAALLLSAMIVVRFRFDVGLATLGPNLPNSITKEPNSAYVAYQSVSSGIMAYWSSLLSVWLALIYLPSAYILSQRAKKTHEIESLESFSLSRESGMKILKLAAIFSPPIINKILGVISSVPSAS